MNKNHKSARPLVIYYQPPAPLPQAKPRRPFVHPFVWAFGALVVIVAMASVVAAVLH